VQKRRWKHGKSLEYVSSHNCSLLTEDILQEQLGKEEDLQDLNQDLDHPSQGISSSSDFPARLTKMGQSPSSPQNPSDSPSSKEEVKRVEVLMVEFDWIFKGESGKLFVDALANTRSEVLFEVQTLKVAVRFLWGFYFYRLLVLVFLPYVLFFIAFLTYATFLYEGPEEQYLAWRTAIAIFCILFGLFSLF